MNLDSPIILYFLRHLLAPQPIHIPQYQYLSHFLILLSLSSPMFILLTILSLLQLVQTQPPYMIRFPLLLLTLYPILYISSISFLLLQTLVYLPPLSVLLNLSIMQRHYNLRNYLESNSSQPIEASFSFSPSIGSLSPQPPRIHTQSTRTMVTKDKDGIVQPRLHPTLILTKLEPT